MGRGKEVGELLSLALSHSLTCKLLFPFKEQCKTSNVLPGMEGAGKGSPELCAQVLNNPHSKLSQHWGFSVATGITNRLLGETDAKGERLKRHCTPRGK